MAKPIDKPNHNIFATLLMVTFFCVAWTPMAALAAGADEYSNLIESNWNKAARTLNFPGRESLGTLIIQDNWEFAGKACPRKAQPARGTVVIPPNKFVTLQAGNYFFRHPQLISGLPADAIDCLEIKLLSMDDSEDELCDKALGQIGNLKGLRVLDLDKSETSDIGLKQAAVLINLEYISAFLTPVRGTFLKDLRTLKKLRSLNLSSDSIADENLKYLSEYPSLQKLMLNRTNVTDQGVKYLAGCQNLKFLRLSKNPGVTDLSIPYFKQLKNLETLQLDGTAITIQGLLKLKGTKIKTLTAPMRSYAPSQMALLRATLKGMQIGCAGNDKSVDNDTKMIYAPLTK